MIDTALTLSGALLSAHLLSLSLAWRKCQVRVRKSHARPRISLIRPVCGLEFDIDTTLRSSFLQDYPDYEILFCASRSDDPAASLAQRLIEAHPHVTARLLIGDTYLSQNPKLNNMAKGWTASTGELVIFADSNLLLRPDYCASIADAFADGKAAVVSSPPLGARAQSFFGEVECVMLNTHAARWQFAASQLGMDFAQGKTLAFRRSAFGNDLMRELAREPAEDAATTKIVKNMGASLHVLAPPYEHPVGPRTARAFWNRHVRWARLRRVTFPTVFLFEAASGLFPVLVLLMLSSAIDRDQIVFVILAAIIAWYGAEYAVARALGWRTNALFLPACLVRDAALPAFYVAAWMSARFEWRGHALDGTIKDQST